MKPEDLAKAGTEHAHQTALFCKVSQNLEEFPQLKWFFAVPNGGERNLIVASRLKAEGVKSGVSDLMLPVSRQGYHGFFIEMKKPKGKESAKQIEFGEFVSKEGYLYCCCDHWEKAWNALHWYMTGVRPLPLDGV